MRIAERQHIRGHAIHKRSVADVEAFSTALAAVGKAVRAAIDKATELGDADTSDLFTGISRGLDKSLWFVEAHLQGEK